MHKSSDSVAIVDFGTGNLHNVARACNHVGLKAFITRDPEEVSAAAGIVLPGVGAMPDAMKSLQDAGLVGPLCEAIGRGTPFLGICLGMQMLLEEGTEFEPHRGLAVLRGRVERFPQTAPDGSKLRVPHIGWTPLKPIATSPEPWNNTLLSTTSPGTSMYFVHSYHVVPADTSIAVATAQYQGIEFVAAISTANLFACQFHPERSGPVGLEIYRQFATTVIRTLPATRIESRS